MSVSSTSHSTSLLLSPRSGSGTENTGFRTQSDAAPGAWLVEEPSKPQMPGSWPSGIIVVLGRSFEVGCVPSIQMYSALYGTVVLHNQFASFLSGDLLLFFVI